MVARTQQLNLSKSLLAGLVSTSASQTSSELHRRKRPPTDSEYHIPSRRYGSEADAGNAMPRISHGRPLVLNDALYRRALHISS